MSLPTISLIMPRLYASMTSMVYPSRTEAMLLCVPSARTCTCAVCPARMRLEKSGAIVMPRSALPSRRISSSPLWSAVRCVMRKVGLASKRSLKLRLSSVLAWSKTATRMSLMS